MTPRLFILLVTACSLALSQGSNTGSAFLKNPIHARSAALGEAVVADPGMIGSFSANPANLASASSEATVSHALWIQEIRNQQLAAATSFPFGSIGISVYTSGIPDIQIRDVPGPALGTFTARATSLQGVFATALMPDLTIGIGVKYLYEKIYVDEHTGYAIDAGLLYESEIEGLTLGGSVTNAGTMNAMRTSASDLPRTIALGASYQTSVSGLGCQGFTSYAIGTTTDPNHLRLGLEVQYERLVSVRTGYQTGYDARGFSFGLGITYSFLALDYAWVPFSEDLGNANMLSLGIRF